MAKKHGNVSVVVPEVAQEDVAVATQNTQDEMETQVTVATTATKKVANVDYIIGRLKETSDMDAILKDLLELKPAYKARKDGDKILMRQIKNIYKFTEDGDDRFCGLKGHKLVVDKDTKLLREMTPEEIELQKQK